MIWDSIEDLVIRKSLLGKPEDLPSFADDITGTILQGILASQKEPVLNVRVTMQRKN